MNLRDDVIEYIRSGETENQSLGLEIEHFVLNEDGDSIGFDLVTGLIKEVLGTIEARPLVVDGHIVGYDTGEYTVTLEPSCQLEISVYPSADLAKIGRIYKEFRQTWEPLFAREGYQLVARGVNPAVETGKITPRDLPLSPKMRYQYMDQHFQTSGRYGQHMMRASASAQVSIDYASEADLVRKLRILQKISPLLMLLMENKTDINATLAGGEGKTHLLRTQIWEDLDPVRTGYYKDAFKEGFGYGDIADTVLNTPLILLTNEGKTTHVGDQTALDLVDEGALDYYSYEGHGQKALIEHFMSMGFPHFRIKKYIEIRVADSVAIEKALAYAALLKGLLYSETSLHALESLLADINTVEQIDQATQAIEVDGAKAVIYHDRFAADWMEQIIVIAANALSTEDRAYLKNFG